MGSAKKRQSLLPRQVLNPPLTASHLPQAYSQHPPSLPFSPTHIRPILLCHPPLLRWAQLCPLQLCSTAPLSHTLIPPCTAGPIQPSTPPLPPPDVAPTFASVLGSRPEQPQSALAVRDEIADFTVVDRKKMRKGSTEAHESKQQALRGTGVNIDCR